MDNPLLTLATWARRFVMELFTECSCGLTCRTLFSAYLQTLHFSTGTQEWKWYELQQATQHWLSCACNRFYR